MTATAGHVDRDLAISRLEEMQLLTVQGKRLTLVRLLLEGILDAGDELSDDGLLSSGSP